MSGRGKKRAQGMIFIADSNLAMENACNAKIIEETKTIAEDSASKPVPMEVKACDYDGVRFHFSCQGPEPRKIEVSIECNAIPDLIKCGGQALLDKEYGKYKASVDTDNCTVTLNIDCDDLPEAPELVVSKISNLKRKIYGAPFDQCLIALANGALDSIKPIIYKFRKDGRVYLIPGKGNVAVVIQICFSDETDRELAEIVLQEFADSQRTVPGSPAASFYVDDVPPAAKKAASTMGLKLSNSDKSGFFLQLAINATHVKTAEKRERITGLMINLRAYLLYHMKCTKAYLLSRMRTKHQDLLKALARARPTDKKKFGQKKRDV